MLDTSYRRYYRTSKTTKLHLLPTTSFIILFIGINWISLKARQKLFFFAYLVAFMYCNRYSSTFSHLFTFFVFISCINMSSFGSSSQRSVGSLRKLCDITIKACETISPLIQSMYWHCNGIGSSDGEALLWYISM